jgi:hypothetical protein
MTRPVTRVDIEVPADVVGELADLDAVQELVRLLGKLRERDADRIGFPSREMLSVTLLPGAIWEIVRRSSS